MEKIPCYTTSKITGKTYDLFSVIRILNILQAETYINAGMELLDIEFSRDRNNDKPIIVFLFDRASTKEVYDKWCKHEL